MATQYPLSAIFGALSDPTRLAVVERLVAGDAPVSALSAPFGMAGPSFLKHLGVLERAGLITTQKQGRVRMVGLAPGALDTVQDWVSRHRRLWENRLGRLGEILDEEDAT
jgi:DNA-binding transcriptional ArsR family regulator